MDRYVCQLSKDSIDDLVKIEQHCNVPPWSGRSFSEEFNNPAARVWGVRSGGKLCGFLACHQVLDEAHIVNFGIDRVVRRQGIGRALIIEVLNQLYAAGATVVTLEVRQGNIAARALYESLGFTEAGVRAEYYANNLEDGLLLRLDLTTFIYSHMITG